jgi:membrane fusion protein (multidrug efflux system)
LSTLYSSAGEPGTKSRSRAMIKPLLILFIAVALILGGVFAWQTFIGKMTKKYLGAMATAPQTVSTAAVTALDWHSRTNAFGTVRAVRGADLAAQASGVVDKIHFESGSEVRAGTILLTLRPNDDPAKLAQLQAAAEIADITYKRDQEQLAGEAISQAVVDTDLATLKSARAQVVAQQALIEEKSVRAPFAGQLGIRQIDEGQYLAAGTTVVTLQALDPIYVDFFVPQQLISKMKVGQGIEVTVDAYVGAHFTGKITSINSKVDSASRNIQARAAFANADRRLIPGMYANVAIEDGAAVSQLTLPQSAITYNPYGDTVYIVDKNSVVQQRFVQVGATRGDQVAVTGGVAVGDVVVTSGQMKLRNGVSIKVNNKIVPSSDVNPTPPNE